MDQQSEVDSKAIEIETRKAYILNPDAQVSNVRLVLLLVLKLTSAALQKREQFCLVASSTECVLCPFDKPAHIRQL